MWWNLMAALWGEIEEDTIREDTEQGPKPTWNEKWRPMLCHVPTVYKPPSETTPTNSSMLHAAVELPKNSRDGNLILHSIELKEYIDEMKQLISSASSEESNQLKTREMLIAPPPPNRYWPNGSSSRWEKSEAQSPDQRVHLPQSIQLDAKNLHLLRRKSAAVICSYAGYEASSGRSIRCLADVLGNYLKRFCSVLRINVDNSLSGEKFEGILERTLLQLDTGGKRELKRYWDSLVKEHNSLQEEASDEMEEFKLVMGAPTIIDKAKLIKSMELPLKKKGSNESSLASPWASTTPIGFVGEEEIAISSEINLENVAVAKTPDLTGTFPTLTDREIQESSLSLDASPPRKKLRTLSFAND